MGENKYYIPELSEFYYGFEYELLKPDNKYYKRIFGKDIIDNYELDEFNDDLTKIAHSISRVKYLDKEDIESLGWEFIKQHPGTTSFDFEKEEYSLNFDPEFGEKWNLRIYDGEDQDSEFNYFSGFIKNKSELVKLLKQLEI